MWLPEYFWKLTIISGHDEKENEMQMRINFS